MSTTELDRMVLQRWAAREIKQWAENAKGPWRPGLEAPIYLGADGIAGLAGISTGQARAIARRLVLGGYAERIAPAARGGIVIWRLTRAGHRAGEEAT